MKAQLPHSARAEHVGHCPGCFRDLRCCHCLPPQPSAFFFCLEFLCFFPAGAVAWQCTGSYLCLQNCLLCLLLLFLPATERSRSFSYQCCSVSKSTHCSLLSHPKYFSHPPGNEIGTIQVHIISKKPQKGGS